MQIDEALVRHVARLARLALSDEEVAAMAPQLARIVAHVGRVRALEPGDRDPATQAPLRVDELRPDSPREPLDPAALLDGAPARDGPFLVVPGFFDDDPGPEA